MDRSVSAAFGLEQNIWTIYPFMCIQLSVHISIEAIAFEKHTHI